VSSVPITSSCVSRFSIHSKHTSPTARNIGEALAARAGGADAASLKARATRGAARWLEQSKPRVLDFENASAAFLPGTITPEHEREHSLDLAGHLTGIEERG
jgi:hypothetical protein